MLTVPVAAGGWVVVGGGFARTLDPPPHTYRKVTAVYHAREISLPLQQGERGAEQTDHAQAALSPRSPPPPPSPAGPPHHHQILESLPPPRSFPPGSCTSSASGEEGGGALAATETTAELGRWRYWCPSPLTRHLPPHRFIDTDVSSGESVCGGDGHHRDSPSPTTDLVTRHGDLLALELALRLDFGTQREAGLRATDDE